MSEGLSIDAAYVWSCRMLFRADVNIGAHYRSVFLWPLTPPHTVKHELICWRCSAGVKAHLPPSPVSPGGSQWAGLHVWMNVTPLSSYPSFLLSLFPYENAITGTCLRGRKSLLSLQNGGRKIIKKSRKNGNKELSKCVTEEAMMETVEVVSEHSPSRLSCDWSLCCCIYDVGTSSLMFCAKLLEVLACWLTPNLLMYIFTYLSKNLWSWGESCQKFIKKKL